MPRRPRSAAALEGLQPPNEIAWRGETDDGACRLSRLDREGDAACRAPSISARSWCGCARTLPADAIITNGAGNFAGWIHRFYRFRRYGTHVAPTSGSMGYGVPAAVAMKTLHPERTVVCIAGDGDFLMTGQEFATAVQYKLPIIVIVADNGIYGTIRMHQEREYPGRVIGDRAAQSGFRRLCQAFGGFGATGREDRRFPAAFAAAQQVRQAGDHPSQDRSGGDHAGHDARGYPRKGAGRKRRAEAHRG